ncbi:UvrA family protein [Rhodoferax ferrireducens T118]|uniref:UvrABC system protein A n=1 Tax=Albidiferax ferrireducens (strain ATCC BAA-621 / DSM 15236 / T118) TaxID=338969 RepID=Q21RT9_ALBFT|nr:excinuclease ABC subunit UvrA [Rhodoferax ferrireducens]ABD71514.1 UvrA family protein [Rhodoferax ferrireducens T118]
MPQGIIRIRGARQHNLKNLDLDIRTGELTVVTGPSGSGKSSLVFDTLFAEGQRRYVETFSAYARQFLDRMDKPAVDKVEGVPPAIAIDQTNPVRSSRSTVGTMTELNDHLKLLFARAGALFDRVTAQPVRHDSPETIYAQLLERSAQANTRLAITFPVELPASATPEEVAQWLSVSGFTKVQAERDLEVEASPAVGHKKPGKAAPEPASRRKVLDVVADRFRLAHAERARVLEAIEVALKHGSGRINVYVLNEPQAPDIQGSLATDSIVNSVPEIWRFSTGLHCPESNLRYTDPIASMFSFNSAVGACDACRGFGRVIGVDYGLVIPNDKLTLRAGAIKPMQTPAWQEAQDDLMRHAEGAGIPRDTPWYKLTPEQQHWVIDGSPNWNGKWNQHWFGIRRFFEYLETKSYKMHIRVLLSKYRSYTPCPTCGGARLKTESLLWRMGSKADADKVLDPAKRFMPAGVKWSREQLEALPGLCLHDLMLLPLDRVRRFFDSMQARLGVSERAAPETAGEPGLSVAVVTSEADAKTLKLLFEEISTRLKYLCEVGIGYLTLDRQSRTLSGGEVQRINLTTALGTSLVNTLFVLDEPSIGLHPRDMHRIIVAMQRLRDAGNTLVVVEHDPAVMLAADRMIDMGPGPGERGGQIVFDGSTADLRHADTLTGAYLGGRKQVGLGFQRLVAANTPRLILEGAREHNLKNVGVEFPLQRLVCITGVSGSGKSTLIQDILAPALKRHFGKPSEAPGAFERLLGAEQLSDVVFVDQSPIGKTARSNPVSYVGAWDAIREIFANAPLSRQRGYTASKFSFNNGDGRCATCGGSGFEHVEMQFLSDVYLRCPDCDGKRYRPEILEITIERPLRIKSAGPAPSVRHINVADVLNLTVSEAAMLFEHDREVIRGLQPIIDVGLEYVKLGQPVPTLSGGEAQRLKLAGFLADAAKSASASRQAIARRGTLFMFDEPTTGLHFDDIAKLMRALRKLLDVGHSLIVIEHNLDVIRASDWLIDLGPEGGDAGGEVVAFGTPDDVRQHPASHTGKALRDYATAMGGVHGVNEFTAPYLVHATAAGVTPGASDAGSTSLPGATPAAADHGVHAAENAIQIINAREHNLKSLSVNIPRGKFTVVTGVSGSGKSTLAFDILFNEGQRRYLESLNAYARSIVQPAGRPEVDAVYGIPPTVAIEQRLSRGGRKSTVGTTTEVWHFLRLLFVKLGTQHCIHDGTPVAPQTPDSIAAQLMKNFRGQHIGLLSPLVMNRKGVYTELADWARPRGFTHLRVDGNFLPTTAFPRIDRFKEHTIELPVASLDVLPEQEAALRAALAQALMHGKGVVHVLSNLSGLRAAMLAGTPTAQIGTLQAFSTLRACPVCSTSYAELDPRLFSYNSKHGWCPDCVGTGVRLTKEQRKVFDDSVVDNDNKGREQTFAEPEVEDLVDAVCPACQGTRLNATARAVKFGLQLASPATASIRARQAIEGVAITELARLSVTDLRQWVETLQTQGRMSQRETDIARDLVPEIKGRLEFLEQVGLGYLTLDRGAPTLSGGEAQRIRLAAQLGSNLQGVCYVLDEPTIGLHPRDNQILLGALQSLSDQGNTLVVVEHDEDTIRYADHIIDIGPSAGKRGGQLVAEGSVADIQGAAESQTGRYLLHAMKHPLKPRRPVLMLADVGVGIGTGAVLAASRAGSPGASDAGSTSLPGKPAPAAKPLTLSANLSVAASNVTTTVNLGSNSIFIPAPPKKKKAASKLESDPNFTTPEVQRWLTVTNATMHNLQHVTAQVPLSRLVAITGVSGSGKSTLARDVLLANVHTAVQKRSTKAGRDALDAGEQISWTGCTSVTGFESVDRVLEVDQTPIGKTPRSCPATYIGFWDIIRKLFADTLEAKARGYAANRFSFNTGEGRCAGCEGQGIRTIAMSFLPDVKVLCETCKGARFNPETLAVTWRGKNIGDVLQMEVDEAVQFFAAMPNISHPLQLLKDVGLGYLTLGQPSPTLSGGEAQRLKLVTELSKVRDDITRRGQKAPHTLYVLDEPTVGLHMADVEKLIKVLHRLVDGGHSVVVIEHDLDVIAEADWVIDLGPDGGNAGGRVVAATTPEGVVTLGTPTGVALAAVLAR